jgi:hypothetical protein
MPDPGEGGGCLTVYQYMRRVDVRIGYNPQNFGKNK